MQKLTTPQVKKIATCILRDFANYCDNHNLKYFLGYGTCLGAVRHKGFIPWDDDIDVMMTRKDYQKLHELLSKERINEHIDWQCIENGKWHAPFGKLVDIRTSANAYGDVNCGGVWIDIFPMDNYTPESYSKVKFWRHVLIARGTNHFDLSRKGIGKMLYKACFIFMSPQKIANKIREISVNTPYTGKIANMCWNTYRKEILDEDLFKNTSNVEFEGDVFKAVCDYDKYLTLCYGDYMKLPPKDKRTAHFVEAYWLQDSLPECFKN